MAGLIHIGEVAALLFVAYVIGWIVGYVLRRVTLPKPVALAAPAIEDLPVSPMVRSQSPARVDAQPVVDDDAMALAISAELASLEPPVLEVEPTQPEPATTMATAMPASRPGQAWAGEIHGRSAPARELPEPVPEVLQTADATIPEPAVVVAAEADDWPLQAPVELDEDAAMRAIEGGWSRRQTRAMPDTPELSDVGSAIAAAQMAVESVLAQNGVSPERQGALGKPQGLAYPRAGRRDNLLEIDGLSELDEATLNNLGLFHFDQIAALSETEVLWLENHAFARGRIGREDWQGQARVLALDSGGLAAGL